MWFNPWFAVIALICFIDLFVDMKLLFCDEFEGNICYIIC